MLRCGCLCNPIRQGHRDEQKEKKPLTKAKAALAAIRCDRTISEIASEYQVHVNQVSSWKRIALDNLESLFAGNHSAFSEKYEGEIKNLHAKIGELTVKRDFLSNVLNRIR